MSILDKEIAKAESRLAELRLRREKAKSRKIIECRGSVLGNGCGARFQIGKLTYIRTHWYVRPSGCNEGDYWNEGEGQFICPKCGNRNRMFDRKHFQELKHNFKEIQDEYKHD